MVVTDGQKGKKKKGEKNPPFIKERGFFLFLFFIDVVSSISGSCNAKSGPTQNRSPGLKLAAKNCPGPQLAAEFSPGGLNMADRCGPLCQI